MRTLFYEYYVQYTRKVNIEELATVFISTIGGNKRKYDGGESRMDTQASPN